MSDEIGHHCGIALVRLKKPLAHYSEKYGTALWGFNQLFLLMEKQHNRGQDGAGIGSMKLNMPPGEAFMFRERSTSTKALTKIFGGQHKSLDNLYEGGKAFPEFPETIKEHFDYGGEILLGHLRYGTSGAYGSTTCHPYFRKSNWPGKNLMVAGNFNLTNVDFLNQKLVERGQHPVFDTDTQAILEETGYHLDGANDLLSSQASEEEWPEKSMPAGSGNGFICRKSFARQPLIGTVAMPWRVSSETEMPLRCGTHWASAQGSFSRTTRWWRWLRNGLR